MKLSKSTLNQISKNFEYIILKIISKNNEIDSENYIIDNFNFNGFLELISTNYKKNVKSKFEVKLDQEVIEFRGDMILFNEILLNIIDFNNLNLVQSLFLFRKYIKSERIEILDIEFDDKNFNQKLSNQIEDILEKDWNREIQSKKFDSNLIQNIFSDLEAIFINNGLKNSNLIKYEKFISNNINSEVLHKARKKSIEVFKKSNIQTIEYILTIPEIPIKINKFSFFFETLDKLNSNGHFQPLILTYQNFENIEQEISISFFESDKLTYINQIVVKNLSENNNILVFNRENIIFPYLNTRENLKSRGTFAILKFLYNYSNENSANNVYTQ